MWEQSERQAELYKIWVMAVLLTGVCLLLYYFHVILRIGTIVTHLFYVPIILASIWWKRKGLLVALFASGLLVLSAVFLRPDVANRNDYFRAFMFVVIAFVVAELSRRIAKEHEALQAANQQLSADEQQLRAANQQLKASGQQLRASNQQLMASEQQLKAANQQLIASQQQLKAANQQLIASQEEIQSLANFPSENSNPVLRIAKDGIVLYSNEAAIPLLTAWGTQMGRRLPDKWRKFAADVFGSGSSKETECYYDDHVLSLTFAPVVDLGYVNVYALEITERKRAEQQLKTSLEEKEVLLREIHHRVKNNLQIIVSLLSLQSEYVKDKQAVELFRQSQFRVKSMALLHERLYETEDLAHINFSDYIRDLTDELLCSYGPDVGNIKLKINVKDVFPSVDVAVPCALITNELVTNCLKHAFPGSKAGEIRIELNLDEQGSYTLLISDDGVGFAKDVDFPDGRTLGLQLVSTLAEQLRASVVLDKSAGTSFKISFSKPQ